MSPWPQASLGELGANVRNACVGGPFGSELTTKDYVDIPGVPVIRGANLGEDGFIDDGFVYVSEEKARNLESNQARRGDIVFTQRGTIGQVAIIPETAQYERYIISQSQMKLSPERSLVDPRYLVYYFRSPATLNFLKGNTLATGVPHINLTILRRVPVPLPPLPEQRRIADILDKADVIRRKRKQAIALTDQLLRSTFLEMFGDPVTNPKGWPEASVGSVADVQGGLQVTHARENNPISVPYLRVANVFRDKIDLTEIKQIRITESEMARAMLQSGDVLVVEGHGNPDELGRAAVWRAQIDPCTHQNHLIRVRPKPGVIDSHYLCSYLNSNAGRQQMLRLGNTTSGLNTISTNNVRSVSIAVPPKNLQKKFALCVSQLSKILKSHRKAECETQALFTSLVDRAFRGELSRTEQVGGQLSMFNK